MERIQIFDTTLRDGEQSPGASMSIEQKYEMALQLARLGVDVIEAGFPVSSPHQFEACRLIAEKVKGPAVTGLCRAVPGDIDRAAEAIGGADHPRIHTFVATSPVHMKYKLSKNEDQVVEMAVKAVEYARNRVAEVEFSPEDGTRSEIPFLQRIITEVIKAGAGIINIPDTVGYTTPAEFADFLRQVQEGVPNMDQAVLSVHCHNDLGLGVANTLAAIQAGARQAEVTVNGIGERAGNASLEELVMALTVRKDLLPYDTGIHTKQIYNTSRLLSNITGLSVARNKPIVGENAFAHESGIHQDGVLKRRETYEIMSPDQIGRDKNDIVLGRHSGIHGFRNRLRELNLELEEAEIKGLFQRFLDLADRKKEVYDEDILTMVGDELGRQTQNFHLDYFNILSGNTAVPTATIRLNTGENRLEEASTGDGPVDAIFRALEKATGVSAKLAEYKVQAVTPGKQALGGVSVELLIDGRAFRGRGSSTDILEASALAYLNAINRYTAADPKDSAASAGLTEEETP